MESKITMKGLFGIMDKLHSTQQHQSFDAVLTKDTERLIKSKKQDVLE